MKVSTLPVITLLCTGLLASSVQAKIDYVIHMTCDGLRGDLLKNLIIASPVGYANFKKLADEGAVTYNARCDYDYSETLPNHTTVITSRPVLDPPGSVGVGTGYTSNGFTNGSATIIHNPSAAYTYYKKSTFDMIHDRGMSTAVFGGKARLLIYPQSYDGHIPAYAKPDTDPTGGDNGVNKVDFISVSDVTTNSSALVNVLTSQITAGTLRRYSFVHLTDADTGSGVGGHSQGWGSAGWNTGVANLSGFLGQIFAALATAPAAIKDKTAIVLTADHGGGGGGSGPGAQPAQNHGDAASSLNYTIPVMLWGPGIPAGVDAYSLFRNRRDPTTARPTGATNVVQPLRNGDTGNLAVALIGAPKITGSFFQPWLKDELAIELVDATTLRLSWAGYLTGATLESASDLSATTWTIETVIPTESAGKYTQTVPLGTGRKFWRLRFPQ